MKRTRRHKLIHISVIFLAYSCYSMLQVLSENSTLTSTTTAELEIEPTMQDTSTTEDPTSKTSTTTPSPPVVQKDTLIPEVKEKEKSPKAKQETKIKEEVKSNENVKNKEENKEELKQQSEKLPENTDLTKQHEKKHKEKEKIEETTKNSSLETFTPTSRPTMRAPRVDCTPPAIEQFPPPLMGPEARKHGGLLLHVLVAVYTFMGLAIVCDEYFVSSLDRICEELKLSPDVAGATFMAAGSSAPELATVVIGVFFAKDDIGVSGVIGSAVFNIMFVISICALCAGTVSHLNWWPLVRDCFFYAVSILVMLFTISDKIITWSESVFMLCMYVVYCVALHYNAVLEKWAETHLPLPASCLRPPEEESALVSYRTLHEDRSRLPSYSGTPPNMTPGQENLGENYTNMEQGFTSPTTDGPQLNQPQINQQPPPQVQMQTQEYYKPKSGETKPSPLIKPTEGGYYELISWAVVYPIHYLCTRTIPDCKSEKYKNWYPFTFFISMIWISFYSYIMVWMITIIGSTLGIPDTVMGLTFVAAGVSVPDALSSIAVIKEGYGDMAVSNAVGSNVFDILICLGLPWFIQTAIIMPGSHVNVISKGLTYSTLSLLSTVVFLVVATHLNGWKLDKRYGIILMIWYLIFIIFASLYELNYFGKLNPPECPSTY